MAISKNEVYKGIPVTEAYHKVTGVKLDLLNQIAEVYVNVYFNKDARNNTPELPLYQVVHTCYQNNPDGTTLPEFFGNSTDSIILARSAYNFLKTAPDYVGAVDA